LIIGCSSGIIRQDYPVDYPAIYSSTMFHQPTEITERA